MKLVKFKSREDIGEWVAPPEYFPGQDIALSIGLKCPQCGGQEVIAIPYDDATMLITLRTEAINFPDRADEIIDTLKKFVDNLDYFTPVERIQFMWGFCNNICIVNWQAAHAVEEAPAPDGKTMCVNCKGHGGTWNGVTDYVECPKCDGWGHTYE